MKKILNGVMSLVMTGAIVTASAFALFSAQATVSGINFSTADAALLLSTLGTEESFGQNIDANLDIEGAYPGFGEDFSEKAPLWIRNDGDVDLDLTAWLSSATGWNNNDLKSQVEVAVTTGENPAEGDWKTLVAWNEDPKEIIPGGPLGDGETRQVWVFVRLPSDATGNIEDATLSDITFTVIGTQSATQTDDSTEAPETVE